MKKRIWQWIGRWDIEHGEHERDFDLLGNRKIFRINAFNGTDGRVSFDLLYPPGSVMFNNLVDAEAALNYMLSVVQRLKNKQRPPDEQL